MLTRIFFVEAVMNAPPAPTIFNIIDIVIVEVYERMDCASESVEVGISTEDI